jgi:Response regulators consisting of a CheY-like receiver domain and a winged-helix DNA-binding domain
MPALNILLVEDNSDDVLLLRHAFQKAGVTHPLQVVSDGLESLEYLRGEKAYADRDQYPFPDVMLLDLNMPRMNGFEVLKQVRENPRYNWLMIHVLTASSRPGDVQRAYDLRANSYVFKPSRMDELVALVTALRDWHGFVCLPAYGCGNVVA